MPEYAWEALVTVDRACPFCGSPMQYLESARYAEWTCTGVPCQGKCMIPLSWMPRGPIRRQAGREPLGVDISDFSDEWCAGFLQGQVNMLDFMHIGLP